MHHLIDHTLLLYFPNTYTITYAVTHLYTTTERFDHPSMAFQDLLQLLARTEAVDIKQAEVMLLMTQVTVESIASGEIAPGDPEFAATAARGEAMALDVIRSAAESVDVFARRAAEYAAAAPGGSGEEAVVADAMRRQAASAAALAACAEKFAAFMRRAAALLAADAVPSESDSDSSTNSEVAAEAVQPAATGRTRRRNAKYFGPEWAN